MKDEIYPFLVADMGGTHARLGLVTNPGDGSGLPAVEQERTYKVRDFTEPEQLLQRYLSDTDVRIRSACLAVAGPVLGNHIRFTNYPWEISIDQLEHRFALSRVRVLNDFAALAYACLHLRTTDCTVLQPGIERRAGNMAVVGPGTGLGVAGLLRTEDGWQPVAGEGGHTTFAPITSEEWALRRAIAADGEYLCVEQLVSGPGLVRLYGAFTRLGGLPEEPLTPVDITERALAGTDPCCQSAVRCFCNLLGRAAGDACLIYGAFAGVYLGGGILPRLLHSGLFDGLLREFSNKGVQSALLNQVPVRLITVPFAALDGAARWHIDQSRRRAA